MMNILDFICLKCQNFKEITKWRENNQNWRKPREIESFLLQANPPL